MAKNKLTVPLLSLILLLGIYFGSSSDVFGKTISEQDKDSPIAILTSSNYDKEIKEGLVFVDFWAPWCGPCRRMAPMLDEIAKEYKGEVKIGKVNVDNYKKFALDKGIQALPTIIVYKDGKEITRIKGLVSKSELVEVITENTKK